MIETERPRDSSARGAGLLLIVTAIATIAAVAGRVAADADQDTFEQSMAFIAMERGFYGLGGAARVVSGIALAAGAWLLLRTWIISRGRIRGIQRERIGAPLAPALFVVSGLFTTVSGACAVALALLAPEVSDTAVLAASDSSLEPVSTLRWLTGKIGFSGAGLALIVAAGYHQLKAGHVKKTAGGTLWYVALASAIIGLAMQLIWIDSATIVHRIAGIAFFLWLLAIGFMLATGRDASLKLDM